MAATTGACGPGYDFDEPVVLTGTVTLGAERALLVDSAVAVEVQATVRSDEILWRLDGTVSATSAGAARNLARSIAVRVDRPSGAAVLLTLPPVQQGLLDGLWTLSAPADLEVQVLGRGPSVRTVGVAGNVAIESAGGVDVRQASGNISVIANGDVLVDTPLTPGRNVAVRTAGSIQLAIPLQASAAVNAQIGPGGVFGIQHERFPAWNGRTQSYGAVVGGGLSSVSLISTAGSVFITLPL